MTVTNSAPARLVRSPAAIIWRTLAPAGGDALPDAV